ncbi:MAG TPA: hypothetical protein PLN38_07285, partial [Chitinophagales bacterium]|nr:hypothetical protein [Chitinophagales bacterium]
FSNWRYGYKIFLNLTPGTLDLTPRARAKNISPLPKRNIPLSFSNWRYGYKIFLNLTPGTLDLTPRARVKNISPNEFN